MVKQKLAVTVFLIIAVVCGVFGFTACKPENSPEQEHVHTYSEEWTKSTTEHWHEATCEHTDEKGDLGVHIDSDNNGKCDKCGYPMQTAETHTHTFDESHWEHDANTHWHAATCGHTGEKGDEAPHVDGDENQFCDECGEFIEHVHKFSETEWAFDETKHWRPAICTHEDEKGGETDHTFSDKGICDCGVKQSEVEVYNALIELEKTDDTFVDWRAAIKNDGVTEVRKTPKGDIVYVRGDDIEAYHITDRTIKVKAVTENGDGIAHVWFKVAMSENGVYHLVDVGTNALAVGETGADGIAELTFTPIGGFSNGEKIKYEILLAEAKDVATLEGGDEAEIQIYPYRYKITGTATGLAVVCEITVSEDDTDSDDILGQLKFRYDASWAASEKKTLPYERRYEDEVNGTDGNGEDNPTEYEKVYNFTATGNNIFDYMYFAPAHKYDWSQGNSAADFDKIIENFRKSASGVYEISFTVTGDGSARLYYWTGNLDLASKQKPDGTPTDDCVVSASGTKPAGSAIADEAFTGENKIIITIKPDNGLEAFQLGMICQDACEVTMTVERKSDYVDPSADYKLTLGLNDNGGEGYVIEGYTEISFALIDIPADLYSIKLTTTAGTPKADAFKCWTSENSKALLWRTGTYEGIIRITAAAKALYIFNGLPELQSGLKINIEKYEIPKLTAGKQVYMPFSQKASEGSGSYNDNIEIAVDDTVEKAYYNVDIAVSGVLANGSMFIIINETETEIYGGSGIAWGGAHFITVVELKGGDKVKFKFRHADYVWAVEPLTINKTEPLNEEVNYFDVQLGTFNKGVEQLVAFIAPKAGTYTLTVRDPKLTEGCNDETQRQYAFNHLEVTNNRTGPWLRQIITRNYDPGYKNPRMGEFTLSEGELILLRFDPHGGNGYSPYQCTIRYKSV